jgi:hypothetical protein
MLSPTSDTRRTDFAATQQIDAGLQWTLHGNDAGPGRNDAMGQIKASSLKRADDYCRQQGKRTHEVDMLTHSGARDGTPQEAELTFACVAG